MPLRFLVSALTSYMAWLVFTFSLNVQYLITGFFVALCVALISLRFLFHKQPSRAFNPMRWGCFLAYFCILLYSEIKAHFDVAYRVLTGRIKPGIIKVRTKARTDVGKTLLGSSITLTPGTLVVSAEDELYMHAIHAEKGYETSNLFERISKRVTE